MPFLRRFWQIFRSFRGNLVRSEAEAGNATERQKGIDQLIADLSKRCLTRIRKADVRQNEFSIG
jgi:hypothetical protein